MKIDIVYISDELNVNLSGCFNMEDIDEVERRIDVILKDYEINKINLNIKEETEIDERLFNKLLRKYRNKIKEA